MLVPGGAQYQVGQSTVMPIKIVHYPRGAESEMSDDRRTGNVSDERRSLIVQRGTCHALSWKDRCTREDKFQRKFRDAKLDTSTGT